MKGGYNYNTKTFKAMEEYPGFVNLKINFILIYDGKTKKNKTQKQTFEPR